MANQGDQEPKHIDTIPEETWYMIHDNCYFEKNRGDYK